MRTQSVRKTGPGTPVSARAAVKKLSTATNVRNGSDDGAGVDTDNDDSRAQTAAAVEQLQERLQQAENSNEEFQKQNAILQTRLDDTLKDQERLEDNLQELNERIEELENQNKENIRQKRDLEAIYEADRASATKERENALSREEELQESIQRLKESINQRELRAGLEEERRPGVSRNCKRNDSSPRRLTDILQPAFAATPRQRSNQANSHLRRRSNVATRAARPG